MVRNRVQLGWFMAAVLVGGCTDGGPGGESSSSGGSSGANTVSGGSSGQVVSSSGTAGSLSSRATLSSSTAATSGSSAVVSSSAGTSGGSSGSVLSSSATAVVSSSGAAVSSSSGPAPVTCGAATETCGSDTYCDYVPDSCGRGGATGTCAPRPAVCTSAVAAVCGCDGRTYGSACEAAALGVDVDHAGACSAPTGCTAGGAECLSDEYCELPVGQCASLSATGRCQPRPQLCPLAFIPVCGCDGVTYGNACEAAMAGQSVQAPGACTGGSLICDVATPCDDRSFCDYDPDSCGAASASGRCLSRPEVCPLVRDPVCGCDGNTYGNRCEAAAAGVDVASAGPCTMAVACGARLPACRTDQFCDWEPNSCGAADQTGLCRARPGACPLVFDPVCGCDGNTYGNSCEAAAAGIDVATPGACGAQDTCSLAGPRCASGRYCDWEPNSCGAGATTGHCVEIPRICPDIYAPVCGCDGRTYGNSCEAAAAGVDADHAGECATATTCGGLLGAVCADAEWCDYEPNSCGVADQSGTCRARPSVCTRIWDPVCGCDGRTYGNACEAQAAGLDIISAGECAVATCAGNRDCALDAYCAFPAGTCGTVASIPGECVQRPQVCPDVYMPVCGCNAQTYANACDAAAAGVNVKHDGACLVTTACSPTAACPQGQYCNYEPNSCGTASDTGTCETQPRVCPLYLAPVCGCDGNTYGNTCQAAAAGVDVQYSGACNASTTCGGIAGAICPRGQFCDFEPNSCGAADQAGTCRSQPAVCPDIYRPVCGCDGLTYGNLCEAQAAGTDLLHDGACDNVAPCGGVAGASCGPRQWCDYAVACNLPAAAGTCRERPGVCPLYLAPVCGCDGNTYGNSCEANAAGVDVLHDGACPAATACNPTTQCAATDYCDYLDDSCGMSMLPRMGSCVRRPDVCPDIYAPVCGCDGRTYSNACAAAAAGVDVDFGGACDTAAACSPAQACGTGLYCEYGVYGCGTGGVTGHCQVQPRVCPLLLIYAPVCGCDGRTYGSDCEANAAGVDVDYPGECASARTCGGFAGQVCLTGEYCDFTPDSCGAADQSGICSATPDACPLVFDPVCGCNGTTYGNTCLAASAGTDVAQRGACP